MSLSVRDYIRKVLRDLTDDEFRTFKANLRDYQVGPGYENIPRGDLENADALKLSDLLVRYYCEDYAMEVASAVLIASNCMPQAQMLLGL
ncbi:pyrin domain-containing protein 1 [Crotalus tigris]|uniref:pyrin domain-containing protein 1 n=1 Tax=Crotalus tigris TaxID=88082 RepID=UPI00192F7ED3|nr:pyrin domain-containing protein 1 [Crotalus tigris]